MDWNAGDLIWFDPGLGHSIPGEILECHRGANVITVQAVINGKAQTFALQDGEGQVRRRQDLGTDGVEDMIQLTDLHEPALLWNLKLSTVPLNGKELPYIVLGDPAYPVLPLLLCGFSGALTAVEDSFNAHMNSARVMVKIAFGRLKARWRCLLKRNWSEVVENSELLFSQPGQPNGISKDEYAGQEISVLLSDYSVRNFPLRRSVPAPV